jgi:hypothetical protein
MHITISQFYGAFTNIYIISANYTASKYSKIFFAVQISGNFAKI